MKTIKNNDNSQIIEKKSKFISYVYYVENVKQAEQILKELRKKYFEASHHCYAYRINELNGIIEKSSDDGEPSGTAGAPMLNILVKNELINTLVVVIRYFGGTLLGTGGLVRAYSGAAQEAIQKAGTAIIERGAEIVLTIPYQSLEYFKKYCNINNIYIINTDFKENVICQIQTSSIDKIMSIETKKQFSIKNIEKTKELYIKNDLKKH